ncbi:MAG: hypothetical protein ACF8XB_16275 [Planctomycetota bacterium JB042]
MVSDNRDRTQFRDCPTREDEGDGGPLVQQHITEETCHQRQERGYHKCHACAWHEAARVKRRLVPIPVW